MSHKLIREYATEFVLYKQSIGYIYDTESYYLFRFVNYSEMIDMNYQSPQKDIVNSYLDLLESTSCKHGTVCVLRQFSSYLIKLGIENTYVVPSKIAPKPIAEPPYFFTSKEISDLFQQIDLIEKHDCYKGREIIVPAIFRLLYCCGLRGKEARTLLCQNVHLKERYLDILQSKGPKSRRIFISEDLASYLLAYEMKISIMFLNRSYFFPHKDSYYSSGFLSVNFRRFWKKAYPDFVIHTRPRAYDLRHHFAWANLNHWASEGMDLNVMLAYLMRYMGHQTISETLYYFRFVPDFFPTFNQMTTDTENILPEVPDENEGHFKE